MIGLELSFVWIYLIFKIFVGLLNIWVLILNDSNIISKFYYYCVKMGINILKIKICLVLFFNFGR